VLAGRLDRRDGARQVAHVVQGVEHPEHVYAIGRGALDEPVDQIVGVVAVAHQVLPAQQHLQARVGHHSTEGAQALPRVLAQKAQAGVEGGAAQHSTDQ